MRKQKYYRFVVSKQGIYEVVYQIDPERNSPKRANKPDGSWLPRIGENYPGAISFWTEKGLNKYKKTGLMKWHIDFVSQPVEVLIGVDPQNILYEDDLQVICKKADIKIIKRMSASDL